jgi:hypothetical protein
VFERAILIAAGLVVVARFGGAEPLPLRDPMQPYRFAAGPGGTAAPRFALTAVLISPARRVAIVNGKPYERGETVDGAEIVRIEQDAVHLREHGNELVVSLGHAVAARKPSQGETAP